MIGVDFGTLSGRAVVVRVSDGAEMGSAVHDYPHAVMDRELGVGPGAGSALPPDWALQVPGDYVDVLSQAVPAAVRSAGVAAESVIGIATDFTACTVLPTTGDGTPLSEVPEFADRPHAYVKLWKHHAAQGQADRINALAHERGEPWINRYGGLISSEWQFAKGLQILEEDPGVYAAMEHFVEAADWIVWRLCGTYVRNACCAGYKGIYQDGAHPGKDFLAALNPDFADFVSDKLEHQIGQLGDEAGRLTDEAAEWTGLPAGIVVAVGNVDAHVTAPAADACEPGVMTAIMGTSTCHVMTSEELAEVPGMCGVVDGGIVSGLWGYEAGQSGVGDIFGWFTSTAVPAAYERAAEEGEALGARVPHRARCRPAGRPARSRRPRLAFGQPVGARRPRAVGVVVGQTLATRPEDTYRALLEATAFGTRTIVEAFRGAGVPVTELVVAGGLLQNHLLMQIYADVTRLSLSTIVSSQGPALGSAIHAAVAAGAYPDVRTAANAMGGRTVEAYTPDEDNARRYDALYSEYQTLHDYFGRPGDGHNEVMHRLRALRRESTGSPVTASDAVAS